MYKRMYSTESKRGDIWIDRGSFDNLGEAKAHIEELKKEYSLTRIVKCGICPKCGIGRGYGRPDSLCDECKIKGLVLKYGEAKVEIFKQAVDCSKVPMWVREGVKLTFGDGTVVVLHDGEHGEICGSIIEDKTGC